MSMNHNLLNQMHDYMKLVLTLLYVFFIQDFGSNTKKSGYNQVLHFAPKMPKSLNFLTIFKLKFDSVTNEQIDINLNFQYTEVKCEVTLIEKYISPQISICTLLGEDKNNVWKILITDY